MRRSILPSVVALLALLAPVGPAKPAHAREKQTVDGLLVAARELANRKQVLEAAGVYGQAVALAHEHGDLLEEARAAGELGPFLDGLEAPAAWMRAAAAVLGALDAKRAGAYVSAHALAREILLRSADTGERAGVQAAAQALAEYARGRHRGRAAAMLAAFGAGLARLVDEPDASERVAASDALASALDTCAAQRWFETATAVGTELAVLRLRDGNAEGARAALARAAEAVESAGGYPDVQLLIEWSNAVRARLPDAPKEVLAPHEAALEPLHGGRTEPGGAGGAWTGEQSALGECWKRLGRRGELVRVRRTGADAVVRLGYADRDEVQRPFRTGQRALALDGVALGFHGHAVCLAQLDLQQVPAVGAGGPCRTGLRAWYLLADGETWRLLKDGRVEVDD